MNFATMFSYTTYSRYILAGSTLVLAAVCLTHAPALAEAKSTDTRAGKPAASKAAPPASKPENKPEVKSATETAALRAAVLDPNRFFGQASFGYAAAQACPEVISKLFCYCGCDITDSHSSLLDCFTSNHGVDCHICQEEAVFALKANREGLSTVEIQKRVDEGWSHHYPFEKDSPAYTKYKANRLWTSQASPPASPASVPGLAPDKAESNLPPKTKSGKPFKPSCCAKDKHS